jgi:hypothetical protein
MVVVHPDTALQCRLRQIEAPILLDAVDRLPSQHRHVPNVVDKTHQAAMFR